MDRNGEAALTTLTAFLGAVIGIAGCLVGALIADTSLTLIAGTGSLVCGCIWFRHLEVPS